MKIEIGLHTAVELRAFATFVNTVADAHESQIAEKEASYGRVIGGLGGINRSPNTDWANTPERSQTADLAGGIVAVVEGVLKERLADTATGPVSGVPVRKRGEPSPGHKRRTKAEIAEDAAAEDAEADRVEKVFLSGLAPEQRAKEIAEKKALDKEMAAISTGGERVAPDDEPKVVEQDAADEASETAQAGAELSHENLRDAMGKYVQKYGMDAAQQDGPKVLALALKDPEVKKISAVPTDQKSLKAALDGINEMWLKNPFSRDAVA